MRIVAPILAFLIAIGAAAAAQEKPQTAPPQEKAPAAAARAQETPRGIVPLKVQIVLLRFRDDKKLASLPYTLSLTANGRTNLRMGIDVPLAKDQGFSYRSVGTNIDCIADFAPGDAYKLNITVEDSSIHLDTKSATPAVAQDIPAFRTFKSNFSLLLRDGQSGQYTSAVDPISGEVMKIDVTLNVLK